MNPAQRPAGVPANAIWLGGPDGGVYVALQQGTVTVYDTTGEQAHVARFVHPHGRGFDASQLASWDGEALHLRDGTVLREA